MKIDIIIAHSSRCSQPEYIHAATVCNQHYFLIVPSIRTDRLLLAEAILSLHCVCVFFSVCAGVSLKSDRVLNTAQHLTRKSREGS